MLIIPPVEPKNLAFAFQIASRVLTGKVNSANESAITVNFDSQSLDSETKEALDSLAGVGAITFDGNRHEASASFFLGDTLYVRMTEVLAEALHVCYPTDSFDDMIASISIQMRVTAILSLLQNPGNGLQIEQREDRSFFLGPHVLIALANAPLDSLSGDYDRKALDRALTSTIVPDTSCELVLEIPSEWVRTNPPN